jgi:hypothetical protein
VPVRSSLQTPTGLISDFSVAQEFRFGSCTRTEATAQENGSRTSSDWNLRKSRSLEYSLRTPCWNKIAATCAFLQLDDRAYLRKAPAVMY